MSDSKIIFDLSELLNYLNVHRCYSGIQRAVVMILKEFQKIKNQQVWICCVKVADRPDQQQYIAFDLTKSNFQHWESPDLTYNFFSELGILGAGGLIFKYRQNKIKYYFHRTRLDIAAYFKNHRLFNQRGVTIEQWWQFRNSNKLKNNFFQLEEIITANDQLVLIDATWRAENVKMYHKIKLKDVKIITMVYDLIPINSPQFVLSLEIVTNFYKWLIQSTEYTNIYLVDSESTKKELREFLNKNSIKKEIITLPLVQVGISTYNKTNTEGSIDDKDFAVPEPLRKISGLDAIYKNVLSYEYILCVGTIEIRKNTWRLVLAWKYLLEKGYYDLPRLVLLGRKGWNNDNLWNLLNSTANLYGYVSVLENAKDEELDILYKNCLFVAMVSVSEGWGLPVGEALGYGKTAVVADVTSLPEVGMNLVEYCDPFSIESIASSIEKLVYQPDYRKSLENKIKHTQLRNWEDVANDLATLLKS